MPQDVDATQTTVLEVEASSAGDPLITVFLVVTEVVHIAVIQYTI